MYLNWGSWLHVGSVFRKVLQAETFLCHTAELVQMFPNPKAHVHTAVWICHNTRTKPVVEVVQTLRGESFAPFSIYNLAWKKRKNLP